MSEHAHNKCTGNWKKERVKVMFLSMLLKINTRFLVASVFLRIVRQDYPSLFAI